MSIRTASSVVETVQPTPETLDRILAENWWYHQMDLGQGRATHGRYGENLIPVAYLLEHVNLAGAKCLDIGAMDGKMSFLMERLGGQVLAVDGVGKTTTPALIGAFDSTVRYRSGVILERLPEVATAEGLFDFALCSGVAYHVYSPFDLIANVRGLLKNKGMALFETAAVPDDTNLFMTLNRGDHYNEHTTLWLPSTACFRYMLRFLSMRVLGECQLQTHGFPIVRHTWLVQAEKPSVLESETDDPWLATLLGRRAPGWSHEYLKPQFDHDVFESRPESTISAAPIAERGLFRLEEPDGYARQSAFLRQGTPAWRMLKTA